MTITEIKPMSAEYAHYPLFAKQGRRVRFAPADTMICTPHKLNRPPSEPISAGSTQCEKNDGQANNPLTFAIAGYCMGPGILKGALQLRGKTIHQLSHAEAVQLGRDLSDHNGGAKFFTSQMQESPEANYRLEPAVPQACSVEMGIAQRQYEKGGIYGSGYDGCFRASGIMHVTASDVVSPAALLAFLRFAGGEGRPSTSPFGNNAFIPHQLADGSVVRGAAEYRDVLFSTYFQATELPQNFVATTGFAAMACRYGLQAMADELADPVRKGQVSSRRIVNFGWNLGAEQGSGGARYRWKPRSRAGAIQSFHIHSPSWRVNFGSELTGLMEGCIHYDWEDTSTYDTNESIVVAQGGQRRWLGDPNNPITVTGYLGDDAVTLGTTTAKYDPTVTNVGLPLKPLGQIDLNFAVMDMYGRLRGAVGQGVQPQYAVCRANSDAYPAWSNYEYIWQQWRSHKPWGYVFNGGNRASVAINMYHLPPWQRQAVSVKIDNIEYSLGQLWGGMVNSFIITK